MAESHHLTPAPSGLSTLHRPPQSSPVIACCLCGTAVRCDDTVEGRCVGCLNATTDITEAIERDAEVEMCRTCGAWFRNPQWVPLQPESPELLALCVRRVKGLKGMRLVDASWIWQEPNSRRLKIKLTVAAEVLSGTVLQRQLVVTFVVKTRNCDRCNKLAAKDTWQAKVQLRQRCDHPRTLLAMEQLIHKHGMARDVAQVVKSRDGLDLTFHRPQHAQRFVACMRGIAPCRVDASKSVVATNTRTGVSNVKHTWMLEVPPLCRGDLVLLPKGMRGGSGGGGAVALVSRVGASLHLLDPYVGRAFEMSADAYWRAPLLLLASKPQLTTFHVLDCEPEQRQLPRSAAAVDLDAGGGGGGGGGGGADDGVSVASSRLSRCSTASRPSHRGRAGGPAWVMAEALVVREGELGVSEGTFARTHLGHLLQAGEEAQGYDLMAMATLEDLPVTRGGAEVVLVAKKEPERRPRGGAAARRLRKKHGGGVSELRSEAGSDVSYLQDDLGELLEADVEGMRNMERMLMGLGLDEEGEGEGEGEGDGEGEGEGGGGGEGGGEGWGEGEGGGEGEGEGKDEGEGEGEGELGVRESKGGGCSGVGGAAQAATKQDQPRIIMSKGEKRAVRRKERDERRGAGRHVGPRGTPSADRVRDAAGTAEFTY